MARTPSYRLNTEYVFYIGPNDRRVIPEGSYVMPLYIDYIPKHIIEENKTWYSKSMHTYCYTAYGIMPVPSAYIREV